MTISNKRRRRRVSRVSRVAIGRSCGSKTKAGRMCKHMASRGSIYCAMHKKRPKYYGGLGDTIKRILGGGKRKPQCEAIPDIVRPTQRCKNPAVKGSPYCKKHQGWSQADFIRKKDQYDASFDRLLEENARYAHYNTDTQPFTPRRGGRAARAIASSIRFCF